MESFAHFSFVVLGLTGGIRAYSLIQAGTQGHGNGISWMLGFGRSEKNACLFLAKELPSSFLSHTQAITKPRHDERDAVVAKFRAQKTEIHILEILINVGAA